MIKKISKIMPALVSVSIVLSGCSKNSEPVAAKKENANQSTITTQNNNINPSPTGSNSSIASSPANVYATPPANRNMKSAPPVKEPTPQIGSGADDMLLFIQVRSALSSDAELSEAVIIEIKEGNATLTGNVSSDVQKTKAAQIVQNVKGVKGVKNNLRVSPK